MSKLYRVLSVTALALTVNSGAATQAFATGEPRISKLTSVTCVVRPGSTLYLDAMCTAMKKQFNYISESTYSNYMSSRDYSVRAIASQVVWIDGEGHYAPQQGSSPVRFDIRAINANMSCEDAADAFVAYARNASQATPRQLQASGRFILTIQGSGSMTNRVCLFK